MGHYVHLHVCFACDKNEPVAILAQKHLDSGLDLCNEARWFLQAIAGRSGFNPGPKGGLSLWGIVGNCTNEDKFAEELVPFWQDLLENNNHDPLEFEHILVFAEHEQTGMAQAIEIYKDKSKKIAIKKHACPFAWMQM